MTKYCAIPGCRSQLRDSVMFSIAKYSSLAQWWTTTPWFDEAKDASMLRDLKICALHFQKEQLDNSHQDIRLMNNVVPSVYLPGSFTIAAVHENYTESTLQADSSLYVIYCRFCGKKQKHPIKNHLEDLVESEDLLQLCLGRGRFLEGFPNGVCDHCLQIITVTTNFIQNCEQAQEKLQKIFFGTSQQIVDSLVEEEGDDENQEESFEMPEAIISFKEEAMEDSDDNIAVMEMVTQDPLSVGRLVVETPKRTNAKGDEQGDIRCTICDRTFNRKRALKAHMESIHEGRIFTCTICGKSMGWRKTLQRHMKSHEENYHKHKCELCDKAFSRPSHLRLHMTKHTGQKVRCYLCKNGYRDTYKLGEHLMKAHQLDQETAKSYAQKAEVW